MSAEDGKSGDGFQEGAEMIEAAATHAPNKLPTLVEDLAIEAAAVDRATAAIQQLVLKLQSSEMSPSRYDELGAIAARVADFELVMLRNRDAYERRAAQEQFKVHAEKVREARLATVSESEPERHRQHRRKRKPPKLPVTGEQLPMLGVVRDRNLALTSKRVLPASPIDALDCDAGSNQGIHP